MNFSTHSGRVGIRNISDYSPFGVLLKERTVESDEFRRGYQGSEKDDEVKGNGNNYTTLFRQLDPRIGRWWSIDPKVLEYESPYVSMGDNPILFNDVLGDKFILEGSVLFKVRIRTKLIVLRVFADKEIRQKVNYFMGSKVNNIKILDNAAEIEDCGPACQRNQRIFLSKSGKEYSKAVMVASDGSFTQSNEKSVLVNELYHGYVEATNTAPYGDQTDAISGEPISNEEIESNKLENLVLKKDRMVNTHIGVILTSTKYAKQIVKYSEEISKLLEKEEKVNEKINELKVGLEGSLSKKAEGKLNKLVLEKDSINKEINLKEAAMKTILITKSAESEK